MLSARKRISISVESLCFLVPRPPAHLKDAEKALSVSNGFVFSFFSADKRKSTVEVTVSANT